MKCPNCTSELIEKLWVSNCFSEGWGFLEIVFWLLLFPLLMIGVIGWLIIVVMGAWLMAANWGKYWYQCKVCGYSTLVKRK